MRELPIASLSRCVAAPVDANRTELSALVRSAHEGTEARPTSTASAMQEITGEVQSSRCFSRREDYSVLHVASGTIGLRSGGRRSPAPRFGACGCDRAFLDSATLNDADPRTFETATAILSGPFRLAFVPIGENGARLGEWSNPSQLPPRLELVARAIGRSFVPAVPLVLPITAYSPSKPAVTTAYRNPAAE